MRQSFFSRVSSLRPLLAATAVAMLLLAPAVAQLTEPMVEEQGTDLGTCKANLVNSKLVLTMWFADHEGVYPATQAALVPDYFLQSVHCPTAKAEDYSYLRSEDGKTFTLTCPGNHQVEGETEPPTIASDADTEAYWSSIGSQTK